MLKREECGLRPIELNDLKIILEWRNSDRIRNNMYTDHVISIKEHKAWFERLKHNTTSVYLVFEILNRPVGLVYFTDIDKKNNKSYWGFYLGEEKLPRGCGTAMGVLGIEYAFTQLNIRKLCGEAFIFNDASTRFFMKLGFVEEGKFVKHMLKNGVYVDIISFALFRDNWIKNRQNLNEAAFSAEEATV